MAARIFAQVLVQGTTLFSRALLTAYQQALRNAKAGGVTGATKIKHKMQVDEAVKILNLEPVYDLNTVNAQYKKFFDANDPKKGGSFYLQSKLHRAREALETHLSSPPGADTASADAQTNTDTTAEQKQ